jgi:hypothetical protein
MIDGWSWRSFASRQVAALRWINGGAAQTATPPGGIDEQMCAAMVCDPADFWIYAKSRLNRSK